MIYKKNRNGELLEFFFDWINYLKIWGFSLDVVVINGLKEM